MIQIRNVSHRIGTQTILDDISLDLPEGGITALIGPNGAGKSTLLSFAARLQPLKHGSISVGGYDVTATPTAELAKILSILTQDNNIISRISVRDLLMFGRYPYHQGRPSENDKAIVENALDTFELRPYAERYLTELSGGQRQRGMIAMVFCQQTGYVLLDEPLNNLDMYHARALMRLLRRLTAPQILFVFYCGCALFAAPFANWSELGNLNGYQWLCLFYCCINTPIAYGAFAEALNHWEVGKVSTTITLVPLFTIAFAALAHWLVPAKFAAPDLNLLAALGAALVVTGAICSVLNRRMVRK